MSHGVVSSGGQAGSPPRYDPFQLGRQTLPCIPRGPVQSSEAAAGVHLVMRLPFNAVQRLLVCSLTCVSRSMQ